MSILPSPHKSLISLFLFPLLFGMLSLPFTTVATASPESPSGSIIDGYRVIQVPRNNEPMTITVFRGDYVKFEINPAEDLPTLIIPGLSINQELSGPIDVAPYFKMTAVGSYEFTLGGRPGTLTIIDYRESHYRLVSATEAAAFIKEKKPFILDVRTPREFQRGRLPEAHLLPVQELQKRMGELSKYQNQPVFIYCATGNRSTVASKLLIDQGFTEIVNLKSGIAGWAQQGLPVVR